MHSQLFKRVAAALTFVLAASAAHAQVLSFSDISVPAGLDTFTLGAHGVMFGDADGDGRPDLYVTYNHPSGPRVNRFYRNLGGVFAEEAAARGLLNPSAGSHGAAWADLDNDGDLDLVLGDTYRDVNDPPAPVPNRIFRNDNGRFVDVTPPGMAAYADYTRGVNALDIDRDGFLDIFAVNGYLGLDEPLPDRNELYRNAGGFAFAAITAGDAISIPAGQHALDTDFDGDGDMDLFAAVTGGPLSVLRNDRGVLTAIPPQAIGITHHAALGISSADLDNDGDLDLILIDETSAFGYHVGHLYQNNGAGFFTYRGDTPRFVGYGAGFADLDNDGDVDLVLPGAPSVYLNDGTGVFVTGPAFGGPGWNEDARAIAFADTDGDGDLDFAIAAKLEFAHLIRNNFNGGRWLKTRLVTARGQLGAYGAKVYVFRAGTRSLIGMREAHSQAGYLAQDDAVLHIGLGPATTVDVEVVFGDGTRVTRQNVSANQTLTLDARSSAAPPQAPRNLAVSIAGSLVTLTWDAPTAGEAVATYVIEAGSAPGLSNLVNVPTGSVATSLTALAAPGTYYVRVRAQNDAGVSAASNEVVLIVGGSAIPSAPSNLVFTRSGNLVTLQWLPAQGATSYLVEVGSVSGSANLAVFDVGGTTTVTASAAPGTYFVRIRARNASGTGPASNEVVVQVP